MINMIRQSKFLALSICCGIAFTSLPVAAEDIDIFTGSSGGAAAAGARQIAQTLGADGLVVTLLPDSGERYLSKLNKTWLADKGLLAD